MMKIIVKHIRIFLFYLFMIKKGLDIINPIQEIGECVSLKVLIFFRIDFDMAECNTSKPLKSFKFIEILLIFPFISIIYTLQ